MRKNLSLLILALAVCAAAARLSHEPVGPKLATPSPKVATTPTEVPMPANALHIRKVWVGMPRAQVEQLHGAGRQLDNGNVGYGKMYSDGLNSHYPLEVLYSASGEVEAVAGDELYRGGHKVTHKSGEVPIEIFEGKYEAQALIAMIVDEHKPEKAHGSIVFRFDEVHPGYSCTSIDGHDRFIISQQ